MSKILIVNNLSFSYDSKNNVLNNLSFEIEKGKICAILGKNGCGKSTLLDCILGINEYREGIILIDDRNLKDYSNKELARKIAYISQNTIINIDYSVRDFLSFGRTPYLSIGGRLKEDDYKKIEYYANMCGITYLLDKNINKISGGERQLAHICRALIQEADLFIFDEPTASLDFGNQYKLFDIMKNIVKQGKTVIFTTHNPNQVLELGTYCIIIDEGTIKAYGDSNTVITEELLSKIYNFNFIIKDGFISAK